MKKILIITLVIAVLSVWMISGRWAHRQAPAPAKTHEAFLVEAIDSHAQTIERTLSFSARTEPFETVDVHAQTMGEVVEVGAGRGQRVQKGALLARLDLEARKEKLAGAQALLRQRELDYEASAGLSQKGYEPALGVCAKLAALEDARAQVAQLQYEIAHTAICAPVSGKLLEYAVAVGDFATVGSPVATVVQLDPLVAVGFLTEKEVLHLKAGQAAKVTFTDGSVTQGTVRYVAPCGDAVSRTFRVEVALANPGDVIPGAVTVQVDVPYGAAQAHWVTAVMLGLGADNVIGVKAVDENSRVVFYPVTLLQSASKGFWVEGLGETVRLITVGQGFVNAGETVRVQMKGGSSL